nr:MCP four helix bundle domain-containing protein [Pantoea stewartii]
MFLFCTATAVNALHTARERMDDTVNVKLKKYQLAQAMYGNVRDMSVAVRNLALLTEPEAMKPELARIQKQKVLFNSNRQALAGIMKSDSTPAGRAAMDKITAAVDPTFTALDRASQLGLANRQQETVAFLISDVRPVQNKLLGALSDMADIQQHNSQTAVEQSSKSVARATLILMLLAGASVIVAAGTCVVITRVLMRQRGLTTQLTHQRPYSGNTDHKGNEKREKYQCRHHDDRMRDQFSGIVYAFVCHLLLNV